MGLGRKSYECATRESLTVDVSTIIRQVRQYWADSIEGPSRVRHLQGQPYDVPHKERRIPKDPIQLSIGLWGPPKKAVSRLKNSHRLDVLIIAPSVHS